MTGAHEAVGWTTPEQRWAKRLEERRRLRWSQRDEAEHEMRAVALHRGAAPIDPYMPDAAIRVLAERRAALMTERIDAVAVPMTPEAMREWLHRLVLPMDGRELPAFAADGRPLADQLAGMLKRVQCDLWWRRCLRRAVVRLRELQGVQCGEIRAHRQVYVTDDTARRRVESEARNRAMLENTEIEAADGELLTLWKAVESSVSNRGIRRAELMTRIRGCEEVAEAAGMVGLFTTNTAPSRFHHQLMTGGRNPKADGTYGPMQPNGPSDAQRWLRETWARCRAALHRQKIGVFGFRVAEPHHDGCPHWHMLLWCAPAQLEALRDTMRRFWLREAPHEPGAQQHRFKAKELERGGAAGYVAKYIAKNIDDHGSIGTEGHRDEHDGHDVDLGAGAQGELWKSKAKRVEAWAGAWGIRQFQAIGQPPVTVWRELRRVKVAEGATERLQQAHTAVHRVGGRMACWRAYVQAQGGVMRGRDYVLRIAERVTEAKGRYETTEQARPIGVYDVARPDEHLLSDRREWRPRGQWTAAARTGADGERAALRSVDDALHAWEWRLSKGSRVGGFEQRPVKPPSADGGRASQTAHPWTRFHNCSRRGGAGALMGLGIVGARAIASRTGGGEASEHARDPDPPQPGRSPGRNPEPALHGA